MKSKLFIITLAMFILTGFYAGAADIKIGALNDMTGATSDVGKDYALGIAEAIHYMNDNGGVNGKKIKLYQLITATGCLRPSPSTNCLNG